MRKFILILAISLISISSAKAAEPNCTSKVCVNVYTENGQLVIEGKRNGATATPTPRPATTTAPKPKPTATHKYTYKPRTTSPKPRNTSNSLADKILQSLPTLQIAYQPQGKALPKLPVIFWSDMPTFFNKDFRILGQRVSVNLKPKSLWSFGDGSLLITDKSGKPYPSKEITHSYSVPGTYAVLVKTIWEGSFTVDGVTFPINGAIHQQSGVDVKVVGASTKFVGK
jgi:hypothetical protein